MSFSNLLISETRCLVNKIVFIHFNKPLCSNDFISVPNQFKTIKIKEEEEICNVPGVFTATEVCDSRYRVTLFFYKTNIREERRHLPCLINTLVIRMHWQLPNNCLSVLCNGLTFLSVLLIGSRLKHVGHLTPSKFVRQLRLSLLSFRIIFLQCSVDCET